MTATIRPFGTLPDGTAIQAVDLERDGISATVITLGAAIGSLRTPDRTGRMGEVLLGFTDLDGKARRPAVSGATIGRYANRIGSAGFELDARHFALEATHGANCRHGGQSGFHTRNWQLAKTGDTPHPFASFALLSPDGDGGFPGRLEVTATYALTGTGELTLTYEARTDRPTVVSMTNHAYFNLRGDGPILDHRIEVAADAYLPGDADRLPTGEIRDVAGTPFDLRTPQRFADAVRGTHDEQIRSARGYDHCFVLGRQAASQPRRAARVEETGTGRTLELLTTDPGLQVYSGALLAPVEDGQPAEVAALSDGFCLEPERFPDAPNRPEFPSARLDPGTPYRQVTVYRFSAV
ncbi:aldose epimerase family protein [Amorphus sp. MBR-141]